MKNSNPFYNPVLPDEWQPEEGCVFKKCCKKYKKAKKKMCKSCPKR